jgi:CBS domain-containing protein
VDTSAINYRVVDFLKKHPPFQAIDDALLLELAARGRVRFHEANEYILWQGEPHKSYVYVLQQGTVSLWDEGTGEAVLKDVRGAGDMLGVERFSGAPCCMHSARSTSDVVIYAFPASDFEDLVLRHPYARQFVDAYETVSAAYQWARDGHDPQHTRLHDVVPAAAPTCSPQATVREVARLLHATGEDAVAVVADDGQLRGTVSVRDLLGWVATDAAPDEPVETRLACGSTSVPADVSVTDGLLEIAGSGRDAVVVTTGDTLTTDVPRLATARHIGTAFGDQPLAILEEIRLAGSMAQLRGCNHRARALVLRYLTAADAVDWLARFAALIDDAIVGRVLTLTGASSTPGCWAVVGAAGRRESLTRHMPSLILIGDDQTPDASLAASLSRAWDGLAECDYQPRQELPLERADLAATRSAWNARYTSWMQDPVLSQMYLARPFFDLRPVCGEAALWHGIERTIAHGVGADFLFVLANDCLASLPPLTFFQDAVVEESGEQSAVFRLEHSALQPLVDVGRVFGMAARKVVGTSTRERFGHAQRLLPEHVLVFREAANTLDILLWQQARIGISQGTTGSELPPALLSRHDRHVLKSGFRSILELVQLTSESGWLESV